MHKEWDFIKKHRFDILVALSVVAFFFDVYFSKHIISIVVVALYAFGYASDIERSRTNIAERKNLSRRGLTLEDIKNIAFTKKWEETREKGMVKYAIVDGGIFFGFALCCIYSIITLIVISGTIGYIKAGLGNMFNFMGYTYIAGFISGTILYRILWKRNERKFIRLTDPLH